MLQYLEACSTRIYFFKNFAVGYCAPDMHQKIGVWSNQTRCPNHQGLRSLKVRNNIRLEKTLRKFSIFPRSVQIEHNLFFTSVHIKIIFFIFYLSNISLFSGRYDSSAYGIYLKQAFLSGRTFCLITFATIKAIKFCEKTRCKYLDTETIEISEQTRLKLGRRSLFS